MTRLNIQENADGVCKYCIYVSVWLLDMGAAKLVPIFAKLLLNAFAIFFRIGHIVSLCTLYVCNLL